jgi:hypothetical protein
MDFSNVRRYLPPAHEGIIILKIRPAVIETVHGVLQQFLESHSEDEIHRTLVIIDRNKYRLRR